MPIFMPQSQKKNDLGEIMSLGQLAVGAYTANPALMAGGAAGVAGSEQKTPQQIQETGRPVEDAMSRRLQSAQQDPVVVLANAKDALSYQPPEIQKEYGATIEQALKLAQQSRQNAGIQ